MFLSLHKTQKLFLNPLGVYVAQIYSRVYSKEIKLSRREQLIMLEIGNDRIDTASSFVDYLQENYGFSKSSSWYCLNRLKEYGLAEFANRYDPGKPLRLTKEGLDQLNILEHMRNELITHFSTSFLSEQRLGRNYNYQRTSYALYR